MFSKTARYYDKLYSFKDYRAEVDRLLDLIGFSASEQRLSLLDVACGTGQHLAYLKTYFDCHGLDLDPDLIQVARERAPDLFFHKGDMTGFDLGRTFDVITCLFSSIGYVRTVDRLQQAVLCMARHLAPGGILVIEPWFTYADWHPGTVHALLVDEEDLKIARVSTSMVDGRVSFFDMHYLVGTPEGTKHLMERHELGLFEQAEMLAALNSAGLEATYDVHGLTGRGLYVAHKTA
jgi:SAM-dependent methyltransferase